MRLGLREWCRPDRAREGSETGSATPYPEPGHLKTSPESGEARCLPRVPLQTRAGRARPGAGRHIPDGETRPRLPHRPPPANSPLPPSGLTLAPPSPARPPSGLVRAPPSVIKPRLCFAPLQVQPEGWNVAAWSDPHLLKRRWPPPSPEAQASSRTRHSTRLLDCPTQLRQSLTPPSLSAQARANPGRPERRVTCPRPSLRLLPGPGQSRGSEPLLTSRHSPCLALACGLKLCLCLAVA